MAITGEEFDSSKPKKPSGGDFWTMADRVKQYHKEMEEWTKKKEDEKEKKSLIDSTAFDSVDKPSAWGTKSANRSRQEGKAGPKREYTPGMFTQDRNASNIQNAAMNEFLANRARGNNLISDRAARMMTDQARKGIASQAAGTGIRYNSAAQMAATRAQASAGQNIAAQTSVAKAQEQAAAQQAYIAQQNAIRAQNQAAMGLGLQSEGQSADYKKFQDNLAANYESLGLSQQFQNKANQQALQDRYMKIWMAQNGYDLSTGNG